MAAIWGSVKNNTLKSKLKGEIMLLQREMQGREKKFGVEVYGLLADENSTPLSELIKTVELLSVVNRELKEVFDTCKKDIDGFEAEKQAHKDEVEKSKEVKEKSAPAATPGQMFSNAGNWVKGTASEVNHQSQMLLIDNKIKARKETFGIDAFDIIDKVPSEEKESLQAKLSHVLANLSEHEKKIHACMDAAKKDVTSIQKKIELKEQEIILLA